MNKLLTDQNVTEILTGGGEKIKNILITYEHGA